MTITRLEVAPVSTLDDGDHVIFVHGNKEIVIFKVESTLHAIDRRCTHMGADLSKGIINDNILQCPVHGARFDLDTGQLLKEDLLSSIIFNESPDINVYPVEVINGIMWIEVDA